MARRLVPDGERIAELLEEEMMHQYELAERIGVTPHTVMRIINGDTRRPKKGTMEGMAEVFGVPRRSLMRWEDEDEEDSLADHGADALVGAASGPP